MKRCESRKGAHAASKISFPFWEAVPRERVSLEIPFVNVCDERIDSS